MLPNNSPARYSSSKQLIGGNDVNAMNDQLDSAQSVVATPAGTQATSVVINAAAVLVSAVASANDGVKLPQGYAGLEIFIFNDDAANSLQVFGSGTDTINDIATATGIAQASQKAAIYKCIIGPTAAVPAARWFRNLSA